MLRTFANCKTKADFLAALGITEGPDLDEVGKILQTAHGTGGAIAKRNVNERNLFLVAGNISWPRNHSRPSRREDYAEEFNVLLAPNKS